MSALAGTLLIDIATNIAQLKDGFNQARAEASKFASDMGQVGETVKKVFEFLAVAEGIRRLHEYGEELQHSTAQLKSLAETYDLTTGQLQAYHIAAIEAGSSTDAFDSGIRKFNVSIGEAQKGSKAHIDTLNQLKVYILDANGALRPQVELLQEAAQKLLAMAPGATRAAAEVALFGKSGQELNPMLKALAEGSKSLEDRFTALGLIISEDTIKKMDELQTRSELTQKKLEALVAPFYAEAKSTVLGAVVAWLQDTVDQFKALSAYSGLLDKIIALMHMAAGGGGTAAGGGRTGREQVQLDIDATRKSIDDMSQSLAKVTEQFGAGSVPARHWSDEITAAREKVKQLEDAQAKLRGGLPATDPMIMPTITATAPGVRNPPPTATGPNRFQNALDRLKAERDAIAAGIQIIDQGSGLASKELERQAQLAIDIGTKTATAIKGVQDPGEQGQIKQAVIDLENLRFKYNDLKTTVATADAVNSKYSDGQKNLAEQTLYLNKALALNRITQTEYNAALKDAQKTAAMQAEVNKGLAGGFDGLAAGIKYAALSMTNAQADFQMGQQLFTSTFQTMSGAISTFVTTGQLDFSKLTASFATMLANMAIQAAASSIFSTVFGSGVGSAAPGMIGATTSTGGAGLGGLISGAFSWLTKGLFASGGLVTPGGVYTVGENGPEKFVPAVAGTIMPNASNAPGVNINIDMSGQVSQSGASGSGTVDFARKLRGAVQQVIASEKRPGGLLWNTPQGVSS